MLKKIILGIVIAAVISVTTFGAVYAYNKEKAITDDAVTGINQSLKYSSDPGRDRERYEDSEYDNCLKEEARIRNNIRCRDNKDQECPEQYGEELRWQHRYEYENKEMQEEHGDCVERSQSKSQNSNNGRGGIR